MAFPIAFAKSFLVTPSRLNHAGGLLSNFQSSVLPSLFFASTKTTIWGFCHCTSVRVPVSVNFLDVSKMAEKEWCAHRGPHGEEGGKDNHNGRNLISQGGPPHPSA